MKIILINDDCNNIIRTLLNKSKKILQLSEEFEKNKNIELVISISQTSNILER